MKKNFLSKLVFAFLVLIFNASMALQAQVVNVYHGGCSGGIESTHPTIQAGVNAAHPNDCIQVNAGNYPEHVIVNKPLTIRGANYNTPGNVVRVAESIVDGTFTGAPFSIQSNNVTIAGFTIINGQGGNNAGVWMSATSSGMNIINNIIRGNTIGIYANSNGLSTISDNLIEANNLAGPSGGAGIYSEFTSRLEVLRNEIRGHTLNNPVLFGATGPDAHKNLVFRQNKVQGNEFGIYVLASRNATFHRNTLSANNGTTLIFDGGNVNATVTQNFIGGLFRGLRVDDAGWGFGPNTNIDINGNSFSNSFTTEALLVTGNGSTDVVNAECNWWGSPTGPMHPSNPSGTGAKISGNADFMPWLVDGTDFVPGTPGFQQTNSCTGADSDGDGDPDATDCAPFNPTIHHGATEICGNGVDDNCNGQSDETDPRLSTTINNFTVNSNNDGADDHGMFSTCNQANNIVFGPFSDLNGNTGSAYRVFQDIVSTENVSVPFCDGSSNPNCSLPVEGWNESGTAALVDPTQPGKLVIRFKEWYDANGNNLMDASECAGDWVVYTITIAPKPVWYADVDGDGKGDPANSITSCAQPDGYVSSNSDNCPNDPANDADGDGVCGDVDNCNKPNPSQADNDNDGIADACDNCPLVANPNQENTYGSNDEGDVCDDTDNDGTPDAYDCEPTNKKNNKYSVCHNGQTICVDKNGWENGHKKHSGDFLGKCNGAPVITAASQDAPIEPQVTAKGFTIKTFPNPSNSYFTLTVNSLTTEKVQVKVFDLVGREVFNANGSSNETFKFGEHFSKGNYLVRVIQADKQATAKVTKQ